MNNKDKLYKVLTIFYFVVWTKLFFFIGEWYGKYRKNPSINLPN